MMEEDGRDEAQGTVQAKAQIVSPFLEHEYIKGMSTQLKYEYSLSKGRIEWKDQADDYLHQILTEEARNKFLKVPTSDIQYLCNKHLVASWLPGMLVDAAMFFRLYNTWEAYICPTPACHCWFADEDSLILHLIREHRYSWPFIQHNLTEEDQPFAEALRSAVWTPIDVEAAMGVAARVSADTLSTFEWPISDDSARRKLLNELQNRFGALLHSQHPMLYNDCLRALIAVASDNILRHLDLSSRMSLPFRNLLCSSPLCFRFMDKESLSFFVEFVKDVQDFLQGETLQSREQERGKDCGGNWTQGEDLEAVSIPDGSDYFVLDDDKIKQCCEDGEGIGAWIVRAPIFPTIKKVPSRASSILQLAKSIGASVSTDLRTICVQPDFKSAGLTSCFKLWNVGNWPMPLFGTMPADLALETEACPTTVDRMLYSSCHSVTEPAKRRKITHDSQMMQHHLELIKLTYKLRLLEGQVRRLCAVDLRMYILPLLRSSLRMKLFMFMRRGYGSELGDIEEEDADTDRVTEGSQEQQIMEETVPSTVKGEPAAVEGNDVTTLCTSKKSEESSRTPLEYRSGGSSTDSASDIDCMAIDGGESSSKELPGVSVGAGRLSPVTIADASPFGGRNSSGEAIAETAAEPDDVPKSDAKSELKAKPESQQPEEVRWKILDQLETFSDTDSQSESQCESDEGDEGLEDSNRFTEEESRWDFLDEVLLETKGTKGTKDTVIFLRMTIADVVKHCLERSSFDAAKNIWEWRTIRTWEYWRCFYCKKKFPDEKSHMVHMVSQHQLGLSWDHYHLVPSQVWQEGLTGLNKDVKERTPSLDDSITVDHTYRRCLVNMVKSRTPYENDENLGGEEFLRFSDGVREIQHQLGCLKHLFDRKDKQCYTSDAMAEVDTEIVQYFARLKMLKQGISDLCFYDCKKDILPHINFFLQSNNLMGDDGLWSWACKRLNHLLCSVRCSYLPDSVFCTQLESSGKVIIKIGNGNSGLRFAYFGLSWKFDGNVKLKGKEIKGSFTYSARSAGCGLNFCREVELDNCEKKSKLSRVKLLIAWGFQSSLEQKLLQFQDEFCKKASRLQSE